MKLTSADIHRLLELLARELGREGVDGELFLVGGAVMCLAFDARPATGDVDAVFRPTRSVRQAANRVAARTDFPETWLNDAVKGFLGRRSDWDPWLDLPNLRVFIAQPEYLLAMKCASMRLGEEFHDLDDVRFLLRYLNITRTEEALTIVARYFGDSQLLPKTRLALEELLPE